MLKVFSTQLPSDLINRLRLHAVNQGSEIREIVADALERYVPQRVVVDSALNKHQQPRQHMHGSRTTKAGKAA